MNKKIWLTTLVILTIFVLTIDYLFIHILFPEKKKALLQRLFDTTSDTTYSLPLPTGTKTSFAPSSSAAENNFSEKLSQCFSDPDLKSSANGKKLLENLQKKFQVKKRIFHSESVNFTNSENKEMRLNALAPTADQPNSHEIHLFDVSNKTAPSQIQTGEGRAEEIATLLKDATITFHQLKETILFGNNNIAVVSWVNEEVADLQTVGDQKAFSCEDLNCKCE